MRSAITCINRIVALILLWTSVVAAHDVYLPMIVDTDSAADDVRAIAMLLNSGNADIRLIVTADGVLAPKTGKSTIRKLLACLNRKDIPVAAGIELTAPPPPFRSLNESLTWPPCAQDDTVDAKADPQAIQAILSTLTQSENDVLYICLGPMTNLAAAIREEPAIISRIYRIIYMGQSPGSSEPGWNTRRDPQSAGEVYGAGMPIYGLGLPDNQYLALDDLIGTLEHAESAAARLIAHTHQMPGIRKKITSRHMKVWDEMAIIYINQFSAFDFAPNTRYPTAYQLTGFDRKIVEKTYARLLGNPADFHLDTRKSVVLKSFPSDASMMREDVADRVKDIIARHGMEEWKACLLTNELHRHLGIYSLVGAKMGIRAREILEAPFDSLSVETYAGLKPPLSCMNDGVQVSTGASLGRGTIRVLQDKKKPSARFIRGDMTLELTLKSAYVDRIKSDIKAAIAQFGGVGPEYFAHIRMLSIVYWQDFDRNDLFEERFIRKPTAHNSPL